MLESFPILRILIFKRLRTKQNKIAKLIPPKPKKRMNTDVIAIVNIRKIKSTLPVENDLKEKRIRLVFIKITKRTAIKINPGFDITIGFKKAKFGC